MKPAKQTSPWKTSASLETLASAEHIPAEVDVAIVGAGISGLTTAALLARAGKRVAVLEMGPSAGVGDTGQTTAHLSSVVDTGMAAVSKNFGGDAARLVAESHLAALDTIGELAKDSEVDCDYERLPAYYYATDDKQAKELQQEREAMAKAGLRVAPCAKPPLPFDVVDAFELADQGQFEPLAYLAGLVAIVRRHGGVVCTEVRHKSAERGKDGRYTLDVVRGEAQKSAQLHAGQVVFATHTPPTKLTLQLTMTPKRTYALGFRVRDVPPTALYYDMEEPYHYVRRHPDPAGDILIVGGCDHRSGQRSDTEVPYAELEAYSRKHWPVGELVYRWSGQVFEPADGLPYIGQMPGAEGNFVITGLSGTGMTSGTVGAMVCADLVLGKASPWAELYAPSRLKPVAQAAESFKHQVEVGVHMVGDRLRALLRTQKVDAGDGAVLREGAHTLAVYNDGKTLHVLSPVCPHAGCYVKFNHAEKCWDCPCHGSRFAGDGRLLSGPATSDLPRLPDHGDNKAV